MSAPVIEIRQVVKRFGVYTALDGIDLDIRAGEFFSLLGPSGCGKTTLLRMIAGFDAPSTGTIRIGGQDMAGVPPNRRPTNMVFQSYAIFPHLNVNENVGYGLRRLRLGATEQARRVAEALEMVALGHLGARRGHELSGGQRQRVALARALVMRPSVLLLDEPLSALDKNLREQMQVELRRLQRAVGITFILVTHDQEEALTLSDRIAVMFAGQIAQVDTPQTIYQHPKGRMVADFIGGMNFLAAEVCGAGVLEVAGLGRVAAPPGCPAQGARIEVGVRPERFTLLLDQGAVAERQVQGVVSDTAYYGDMTYYYVTLPGVAAPVVVTMRNTAGRRIAGPGETVAVGWGAESLVLLD